MKAASTAADQSGQCLAGSRCRARPGIAPRAATRCGTRTGEPPPDRRLRGSPRELRRLKGDDLATADPDDAPPWPARGDRGGGGLPTALIESTSSWVCSAKRTLVLVVVAKALAAPVRRWVASSRWMPRLLPRWARSDEPGRELVQLGGDLEVVEDKSSRGSGLPVVRSRAARYSPRSAAFTDLSSCSRRRSSAVRIRTTCSPICSSRSEMRPTVCGSRAHWSSARPPRQSMRRKLTWSGSSVVASPAITVRSSSLLPAPAAPTTRP